MRKCCLALLLFLFAAFSLSAQLNTKVSVFFASITGPGQSLEDNQIINEMITGELSTRNYTMLSSPQGADYLLYGTLDLYDIDADYVSQINPSVSYTYNASMQDYTFDQLYILQLILRKADTGEIVLQNVIYTTIGDIYVFFPILANNLILHMGGLLFTEEWPNRWLYVGVGAFWTPRIYYDGEANSGHFNSFGGGISAEAHLLKFLAVELGVELASDWLSHALLGDIRNVIIEVPFMVKYIGRLTNYFILSPYAGIHANISLLSSTTSPGDIKVKVTPPMVAWMAGFSGGIRLGGGFLYFEPRFSMDIGHTMLQTDFGDFEYQRYVLHFGIGYKYGFIKK